MNLKDCACCFACMAYPLTLKTLIGAHDVIVWTVEMEAV
jgi:hypothetical protein